MDIAMIGLGKVGANMTTRMLRGGHGVIAYDLNEEAIQAAEAGGAEGARTLDEVVAKLDAPRAVWVMVPAGDPTEKTVNALAERLSGGDIILDRDRTIYKIYNGWWYLGRPTAEEIRMDLRALMSRRKDWIYSDDQKVA